MKKLSILISLLFLFLHLMYANDGPNIWTQSLSGVGQIHTIAVNPTNQLILYAGSNTTGMHKSTNGGVSWVPINTGLLNLTVQTSAISASNPNVIYCGTSQTGGNAGVYKSTDAGASWTLINNGIQEASKGIQGMAVSPTDPNTAYMTLFDGVANSTVGLYKTSDGGANWLPQTNGIGAIKNFLPVAINPLNHNVVYAGTSFTTPSGPGPSKIYKTVNAGANWVDISNGLPQASTEINPVRTLSISTVDTGRVLAGLFMNTTTGGAYFTTNGGSLWTRIHNAGLQQGVGTLIRACLIRPGSTSEFFVGIDGGLANARGVWRTTNAGVLWTDFNGNALLNTFSVRALNFRTLADSTVYAGVSLPVANVGLYEYSFIPVGINNQNTNVPNSFALYQNFPNPFNPVTLIQYDIPKESFVTLRIYDIGGKEVKTIVNESKQAGAYQINFDASGLTSGVYFYTIKADDFTETKKMLLLK